MSTPLPTFEHEPLIGKDGTRLIKLHSADPDQEAIKCEIVETTLARSRADQLKLYQSYHAISWYWGPESADKTVLRVTKDGRDYNFPISSKLEEALKAFRHNDKDVFLWIDALCINQRDIKERNHQVSKMNRIYAHAERVCIWTGPEDDASTRALSVMKQSASKLWAYTRSDDDAQQWSDIKRLLTRKWFGRRWVVQEVALAEEAYLYCGRNHIEWKIFSVAISLLVWRHDKERKLPKIKANSSSREIDTADFNIHEFENKADKILDDIRNMTAVQLVEVTSNVFRRTKDGQRSSMRSLEYLVSRYGGFQASQPRDIIYAFLALAKDTSPKAAGPYPEEDPETHTPAQKLALEKIQRLWAERLSNQLYKVDYDSPTVEVYMDYVLFAIRQSRRIDPSGALDILCRPWAPRFSRKEERAGLMEIVDGEAQFQQRENSSNASESDREIITLPTWMCDSAGSAYYNIEKDGMEDKMQRRNADPLTGFPLDGERYYNAAGTRGLDKFDIVPFKYGDGTSDAYSLFVEGFTLGTVEHACNPALDSVLPSEWAKSVSWNPKHGTAIPDEFWRSLVADRGPHGANPSPFYATACENAFKAYSDTDTLNIPMITLQAPFGVVTDTLRRIEATTWNRRLIFTRAKRVDQTPHLTEQERRIGLAPSETKEGDLICILYGCSVPVMLRKVLKTSDAMSVENKILQDRANQNRIRVTTYIQKEFRLRRLIKKERDMLLDKSGKPSSETISDRTIRASVYRPLFADIRTQIVTFTKRLILVFVERQIVAVTALVIFLPYVCLRTDPLVREFEIGALSIGAVLEVSRFMWERSELQTHFMFTSIRHVYLGLALASTAYILNNHGSKIDIFLTTLTGICIIWAQIDRLWPEVIQKLKVDTTKLVDGDDKGALLQDETGVHSTGDLENAPYEPAPKEYFEVIGACYIDGMMDGEAIKWQNDNEVDKRTFELR